MWDIVECLDHVHSHSDKVSPKSYGFMSNERYYYPTFHESFHDAWLIDAKIKNSSLEDLLGHQSREDIAVGIKLLGPYHDLIHEISYFEVGSFSVHKPTGSALGDLLDHRFHIDDVSIRHQLNFVAGSISISFREIEISTRPI